MRDIFYVVFTCIFVGLCWVFDAETINVWSHLLLLPSILVTPELNTKLALLATTTFSTGYHVCLLLEEDAEVWRRLDHGGVLTSLCVILDTVCPTAWGLPVACILVSLGTAGFNLEAAAVAPFAISPWCVLAFLYLLAHPAKWKVSSHPRLLLGIILGLTGVTFFALDYLYDFYWHSLWHLAIFGAVYAVSPLISPPSKYFELYATNSN